MQYATFRDKQVTQLMISKGILTVDDLSIDNICEIFNIDIIYHPKRSNCFNDDDYSLIYLDNRLPYNEQRFKFFHELSHVLFHTGKQKEMNKQFNILQESQAYWIALYTSMPRHIFEPLLLNSRSIETLIELFELPQDLIAARIETIRRARERFSYQMKIAAQNERHRSKSLQPGRVYDTTTSIVKQLANQVGEENINYEVKRLLRGN